MNHNLKTKKNENDTHYFTNDWCTAKGKWEAVSFIMNGDEMLGEAIKYNAYEFKDYGEMTTYTDGRTVDMTYRMKDNKMQLFGDNGSLNVDITRLTQEELVLNYDTGRFKVTAKFER